MPLETNRSTTASTEIFEMLKTISLRAHWYRRTQKSALRPPGRVTHESTVTTKIIGCHCRVISVVVFDSRHYARHDGPPWRPVILRLCRNVKSFARHRGLRTAMMSVSVALSQTPADAASPRIRSCIPRYQIRPTLLGDRFVSADNLPCPRIDLATSRKRKCADTIGTLLVPLVVHFQC